LIAVSRLRLRITFPTISRINVAHFMARLAVEDELWQEWKGQMPVIYNKEQS
jgi:hypothetical protein